MLKFQQELLNLGQDEGEGLEKICYAPVIEANQSVTIENCVVQSIFGYIQNNYAVLDEDYEFLGNFTTCSRYFPVNAHLKLKSHRITLKTLEHHSIPNVYQRGVDPQYQNLS